MSCIPWITKVGRSLWAMRYFIGNRQHLLLSELHRIWGDVFWFFLGTRRATVLADPAAIREMFQQPADVLSAAESRRRLIGVLPSKSIPYQTGPARATSATGNGTGFLSNFRSLFHRRLAHAADRATKRRGYHL